MRAFVFASVPCLVVTIKHPNVMEETLEAIAQGVGPVAANARRELDRRRADARRELERRREWGFDVE